MQLILAPRFVIPILFLPGLLLSRALRKSLGSLFGSSSCYSFHGTQTQFSDLWHTFPASRFNNYNFKFKIVNHLI